MALYNYGAKGDLSFPQNASIHTSSPRPFEATLCFTSTCMPTHSYTDTPNSSPPHTPAKGRHACVHACVHVCEPSSPVWCLACLWHLRRMWHVHPILAGCGMPTASWQDVACPPHPGRMWPARRPLIRASGWCGSRRRLGLFCAPFFRVLLARSVGATSTGIPGSQDPSRPRLLGTSHPSSIIGVRRRHAADARRHAPITKRVPVLWWTCRKSRRWWRRSARRRWRRCMRWRSRSNRWGQRWTQGMMLR